jgi:tRNA threonylcarbamoyladenosine biosynthesis protein TsaE
MIFKTNSEDETIQLGEKIAGVLIPGDIVALYGDLGSGKTEFVKGICRYFDVDEIVTSPTFTIVNKYYGFKDKMPITIYHIDLYRIEKEKELIEIGFNEYLKDKEAITFIEWSEKTSVIPESSIKIEISLDAENDNVRFINCTFPREIKIGV